MKINTHYSPAPIPCRGYDWSATYDNYDGAEDSGNRCHIGYGSTEDAAIADLIENYPRDDKQHERHMGLISAIRDIFRVPQS